MLLIIKKCFSIFVLFSFLFQTLYPSLAVAMDRAHDDEPVTSHERHLKKAGYWSLHQEIKTDKFSFLHKNPSLQGHKGVAYLSHLGRQIETLLAVPYPDRLKRQCDELERLSNWVYAISAHACGFSGFDRQATPEEAKRMRRALTFSLMANGTTLVFKSYHDPFDPYYINNPERQLFFKSVLALHDVFGKLIQNQFNDFSIEHYKRVVLPETFKKEQKIIDQEQSHLQKQRAELEQEKEERRRIKERAQRSSDEEPEDEYSKRVKEYSKKLNIKVVAPAWMLEEARKIVEQDEEALRGRDELLTEKETGFEQLKEFFEFQKVFCEHFDYEELDALIEPYVSSAKNLVGIHATIQVPLLNVRPLNEQMGDLVRIYKNDTYYDDDESTDDETPKAFQSLKTSKKDTIEHLLDTWRTNGVHKQFRQYFKDIYWQDKKRKRSHVLTCHARSEQRKLEYLNQLKEGFSQRVQEYQEAKIQQAKKQQTRQGGSKIVITGATINAPALILHADEVVINSGTSHSTHSQSVSHSNFFGKQAYGQTTYQEIKNPSQLNVNTIILGQGTHLTMVDSTQVRPDLKIQGGSYTIKPDDPAKAWTTSWSRSSQTIPTPVICALSIGASVLTQGLSTGLMGVAMGTLSGTAVQATLTGNDPFKAIASEGFLKNLSFQLATAGLTNELSKSLGVNINPGSKDFIDHLKGAALKQAVHTSFKVALGDQKIKEALTSALKNIGIDAVTGYAANQIGQVYGTGQIDSLSHKALHGVLGGATGYALGGNQQAIISGAVSAVAAEVAFEMMVSKETVEQRALGIATEELRKGNKNHADIQQKVLESFRQQRDLAKMAGMMSSAALDKDADIAWQTAGTAVDNNTSLGIQLMAAPTIHWAIANYDKVLKGINQAVNLYTIYERTGKEAERQKIEARKKQDKHVSFPNNPDGDKGKKEDKDKKFEPYKNGSARNKEDGSIWEKDRSGKPHGSKEGEAQWKRWDNKRSYEKQEKPASIWSDGRARGWGDQKQN